MVYFCISNKGESHMFKRTWKQLKIFIILGIVLICLPHSILPHRTDAGKDDFDTYKKLNNSEHRLKEFKDSDESLKLKIAQLEIINSSRKKNNAPPVRLDILASRVANKMAKEAAENEFLGHWNMAGETPYVRYAFAGGNDHVTENAFGEWSSDNYNSSGQTIAAKMKSGHQQFMAEKPPADGHKVNVIAKSHNFVGIGFCLSGKQFRYYEEFIDRYFEFANIPSEVKAGAQFNITVKTNGDRFLFYMIAYRQKFPTPISPEEISKKGSYSDFTEEEYKVMPAWELARYRNGTDYTIPLSLKDEGLYYIQLFSDKKELTKAGALSTKGKTPESGIVIKVRK
jgi:uncharacterized protein YkwD